MKKKIITIMMCLQAFSVSHAKVKLVVEPISNYASVNMFTNVITKHNIEIKNETSETQTYNWYYKICVQNKGCNAANESIKVLPNNTFKQTRNMSIQAKFSNPGDYQIIGMTIMSGAEIKELVNYGTIWVR